MTKPKAKSRVKAGEATRDQNNEGRAASEDLSFTVQGTSLSATHYFPVSDALRSQRGAPAVVMAHGLSMTRDSGLEPFALRFAAAGMHVLVFDYRCFGSSGGEPRELVSAKQQVADYRGALAFVRTLPDVDAQRVGVWGTSYSGGVALQCTFEDQAVSALVLQVPNLDNAATAIYMTGQVGKRDPLRGLWIIASAVADVAASVVGLKPVYVQAIGRAGERAAYVNSESMDAVGLMRGPAWKNRIALRDFATLPIFRPIRHVRDVKCPIQIFAADRDDLTPTGPALRAAKLFGERAELHRYPVNHFDLYNGALFEDVVAKQAGFFAKHLKAL